MSRRFSMTSNPVRASESQDEAEPLLGDAERKCDDVVEAIGFGGWDVCVAQCGNQPVRQAGLEVLFTTLAASTQRESAWRPRTRRLRLTCPNV